MTKFKQYRRKQIAELRPVEGSEIEYFAIQGRLFADNTGDIQISISDVDLQNGSPKIGDMIARNPKNHEDQWLVSEQYFNDNFEVIND